MLILVYGASLALTVLSSAALAIVTSEHLTTSAITAAAQADQATVGDFVAAELTGEDLRSGNLRQSRRMELETTVRDVAGRHGYLELSVLAPDGSRLLGDAGRFGAARPGVISAEAIEDALVSGRPSATMSTLSQGSSAARLLVELLPVVQDGQVRLLFVVVRDGDAIVAAAAAAGRDVMIVVVAAAATLAVLLHLVFRAANSRLMRQEVHLVESRRHDPLTGLLNHGSIVATLTELVEAAKQDGSSIGVALVDIDNFRLLNDVHGDPAGDEALVRVADALEREAGAWLALGRFGPDEFMAIAGVSSARDLEAALKRVQAQLEEVSLEFGGSERLPLTVCAGITYFPFHANAVIDLLSAATIALGEAKGGGGNAIRLANAWTNQPRTAQTTFDVLQGLVFAIDTKDRYTKRHSEDVACYALFLADRLGLPSESRAALQTAGLLHDVGKIGIPDDILRKPGRLTPYEYEAVKQHVALGDLIVRDLPDLDLVRAGIRHHHERWDGDGYLDGLAAEEIPLIARILAVGDAFSAMTTTRPYRKALSIEEALDRLREAAGTQLDETLVAAFVAGIETDQGAPLPGSDRRSSLLWTPVPRAA